MPPKLEYKNTQAYAQYIDGQDSLKSFREKFYIPLMHGRDAIYFTGNSLGLQPKSTQEYVLNELEDWANFAVEGHFHARNPGCLIMKCLRSHFAKLPAHYHMK